MTVSPLRASIVLTLALFTSGCLKSHALVKVKPDGSGTIEQTMLVNLATLKSMLAGMGAAGGQIKESGGVMSESEFKTSAERMGVRPVSLTPLTEGPFTGARAVYAFDDITTVRVDQNPQVAGAAQRVNVPATSTPIKFAMSKQAGSSVLTITVNEQATASAATQVQQAPSLDKLDPAMQQMLKTLFDGFHVQIDLEVDGKIVKTNADYVSGSRITLMELDLAALLADQSQLKALQSAIKPGATISEIRPLLKDVPGVRINHPSLRVEFR